LEVDVLVELARTLLAVETKSGATIARDFFDGIEAFASWVKSSRLRREVRGFVVDGGSALQRRSNGKAVPWSRPAPPDLVGFEQVRPGRD
jgi:hypothetical protein